MSKYIIELKDDVQVVQKVGVTDNGNAFVMNFYKDQLEELTADYINEHFGSLQDDAYHRGLAEGKKAFDLLDAERDAEYQRGLDDAWEAARKVGHCKLWDDYTKDTGKPSVCAVAVLDHYTAYEAIAKLKAYEAIAKLKAYEEKQKADDEIKVGDEVEWEGVNFTVLRVFTPKGCYEQCDGFDCDGNGYTNILTKDVTKTNRHFDISSILKEMQS